MEALLAISRAIDWLNERIGRIASWLVLIAVLVSSTNATFRYAFNLSSNAWLEIQWYLFSAIFLLASGYTLKHNQHIRIDIISSRLSRRTQTWIDILGTLLFLFPMAMIIMWLSWPVFINSYQHHEVSTNAGGLTIWPARLLMPAGFLLLILQGLSELIKRIAFLCGAIPDPAESAVHPGTEDRPAGTAPRQQGTA